MKKILVIGIIFILLGGVFCGAAYAMSEKYVDSKLIDTNASFASEDVGKIYIGDMVASVKFLKAEGRDIYVKAENIVESEFKCTLKNNYTLDISYNPGAVKFGFISLPSFILEPAWNSKPPVINIYIPDDKMFDEVYFSGGVGSVRVEEINTKSLILNGGVGENDIKNIYVENLKINVGV